jgi:hypothetical protein
MLQRAAELGANWSTLTAMQRRPVLTAMQRRPVLTAMVRRIIVSLDCVDIQLLSTCVHRGAPE